MRTYRNASGELKAPAYTRWASNELGMGMMAVVLGMTIDAMKRQFHLNDWQVREVIRKWAEESTGGEGGGPT